MYSKSDFRRKRKRYPRCWWIGGRLGRYEAIPVYASPRMVINAGVPAGAGGGDPDPPPSGDPNANFGPDALLAGQDSALYDSTYWHPTFGGNNYVAGEYDPTLSGCKPYDHAAWQRTCPDKLTFAALEAAFQPVLDWGNEFRASTGNGPMIWDNYLALAAQRHATFYAEHKADLYTGPSGLSGHAETLVTDPVYPSYGQWPGDRVALTGRENTFAAEGIGFTLGWGLSLNTPMGGFCNIKSDYQDQANCGHFCYWKNPGATYNWVGYGMDVMPDGSAIHVFVYSNAPAGPNSEPLFELYEYLPKFDCP